jgi:hypothetical protein
MNWLAILSSRQKIAHPPRRGGRCVDVGWGRLRRPGGGPSSTLHVATGGVWMRGGDACVALDAGPSRLIPRRDACVVLGGSTRPFT